MGHGVGCVDGACPESRVPRHVVTGDCRGVPSWLGYAALGGRGGGGGAGGGSPDRRAACPALRPVTLGGGGAASKPDPMRHTSISGR